MLIYILSLSAAILILLILMGTSVYLIFHIISWLYGAPYVPTSYHEIRSFLKKVPLHKNAKMIELGCGDGRVLRMFAEAYGISGTGYDINPIVLGFAQFHARRQNLELRFINKDIRKIDFSDADVIYIFLFPKLIEELRSQLLNRKKSAIVISHGFKIPFLADNLAETYQGKKFKTYIYTSQKQLT